jgi:RNA polymerase sigma-70 factor, ECF subfamily
MAGKQQETGSFEALFKNNYQQLCQRVARITSNMESAEDVVQEVFISYWHKNQQQTIARPEAYLYRACINKALNLLEANKHQQQQKDHLKHLPPEQGSNPEQALMQLQLEEQVQHIIAQLPPMCQKVFLLSRYEGMSHKEIAVFLDISPNTVDNHLKKALSIFRSLLLALLFYLLLVPVFF